MIILMMAAASTVALPQNTPDEVLAALKAEAESYEPRGACSVTVAAEVRSDGSDGETNEDLIYRYDHTEDTWQVIQGPEQEDEDDDVRSAPQDWYARALLLVAAADRAEEQADGSIILHAEELPKGTLMNDGRDNSKRSRAETIVSVADGSPVITGYRVTLKKPFRIPLVVRVKDFSEEAFFGPGDERGPLATQRISRWDVSFTGGSEKGTATMTYSDYVCPDL